MNPFLEQNQVAKEKKKKTRESANNVKVNKRRCSILFPLFGQAKPPYDTYHIVTLKEMGENFFF